jgi:hypothetical protein
MNNFVLLQNYARNLLLRYFLGCGNVLDVEPGFRGSLEVFTNDWRGKVKVVGRERTGRNLYLDPRWQEEDARVLAVFLHDCGMVWLIDAPKLWGWLKQNRRDLEEKNGKVLVPWAAVQQLGSTLEDLRSVPYMSFERYAELHQG